jgi:hypothetical protein
MQRPHPLAALIGGVGLGCLFSRLCFVGNDQRVERRIVAGDARQVLLQQFGCGNLAHLQRVQHGTRGGKWLKRWGVMRHRHLVPSQ